MWYGQMWWYVEGGVDWVRLSWGGWDEGGSTDLTLESSPGLETVVPPVTPVPYSLRPTGHCDHPASGTLSGAESKGW